MFEQLNNKKSSVAVFRETGFSSFFKPVQPKLTINQPNDIYEQEADAMADKVMRMTDPSPGSNPFFSPAIIPIQRKCAHCEEEEKQQLQRKEMNSSATAGNGLDTYVGGLSGGGQALSNEVRSFFEPRMGYDFSNVHVHTDGVAAESAQSINALAYTSGNNIVFNSGQYSPGTDSGKRLLGHELTHVVQQNAGIQTAKIQRLYQLNNLFQNGASTQTNPVTGNPDVYFFPGSSVNTTNRKALVIAGIHGSEPSARALGHEVKNQLLSGSAHTDFHTIVVPQVNPSPTAARSAGRSGTSVPDLNREFGAGYSSPNPVAQNITQIVTEFDPERVISIHAISNAALGGVFLDPVHSGTYPATGTPAERQQAFTADPRNLDAMHLTEGMINAIGNSASTPGNAPTRKRPASQYPGTAAGSSADSLIYPLQGGISTTGQTSLGVWVSGLGKPIITIEIPDYNAPRSVWGTFLPAVWEFLRIPAPPSAPPQPVPATSGTSSSSEPVRRKMDNNLTPSGMSGPLIQRTEGNGSQTQSPDPVPAPSAEPAPPESIVDWILQLIQDLLTLLGRLSTIPAPLQRESRFAQLAASCLSFANRADLDAQKAHWTGIIAGLSNAEAVNWVIGISLPAGANSAITESVHQKDCMLSALSASAHVAGSPIQLPGSRIFSWSSSRRDFAWQSRIWNRKFSFDPTLGLFDRISDRAPGICSSLLLSGETRWNTTEPRHRRCWGAAALPGTTAPSLPAGARSLTDDEKQFEILQASSAPGISRHHWGTDFDLFGVQPAEWETSGPGRNFADEYSWLLGNASTYGFIQSFTPLSAFRALGYMEERWHWSYWPVAQALLEFVITHQPDVERTLLSQWGTQAQFSFIRSHWREFMNNVNQIP